MGAVSHGCGLLLRDVTFESRLGEHDENHPALLIKRWQSVQVWTLHLDHTRHLSTGRAVSR